MSHKTVVTAEVKLEMNDYGDPEKMKILFDATMDLLQAFNQFSQDDLTKATSTRPVYVPVELWKTAGGKLNATPDFIRLSYSAEWPSFDPKNSHDPRTFFIQDLASASGLAPRVHMARHFFRQSVKVDTSRSYCGSHNQGEAITDSLAEVTCPECLQEIARQSTIN